MTSAIADDRPSKLPWLFGPWADLATFGGSCLLAIVFLAIGGMLGVLHSDTPEWTWVIAILLIDVAHVYATGFRVYFDQTELRRRPWLYGLTPILAFAVSWAVYSESATLFWRCLAYLAVFHFIRQQYGWVALYRRKANERSRAGKWIDSMAIYLATIYPLVYWHCHLPRGFWWFQEDDFASLNRDWSAWLAPVYWSSLLAYSARSIYRGILSGRWNPGKDLVVATTALCWYVGIVWFNSDYAFTVTNVIIHGIPYLVLVYWYQQTNQESNSKSGNSSRAIFRLSRFLGLLWVLAYAEELLWDRGVWHERDWLFGGSWSAESLDMLIVPLLAVPQITHYVLDGFIWRRSSHRSVEAIGRA
ncbi:hypothetical protein [Rhodopirellula sp. MGV]|uniref:hypothetical protein n=1 Tax=Rhodopirellula sp. MGV TaxID=2023130 RepID=UPI000B96CD2A|nr:hypothetical protein [Rhodopirellula sp. MGV]OYP38484.1 hypothetical protein CGZ80_01655 [Rhodopirellula sp. MGV]PNY33496.1 hypothetical protein C2E31_28155 [Rhodopirellula baltica]